MKGLLLALCLSSLAFAQSGSSAPSVADDTNPSLGDAAKKARENKPTAARKVYTEEDLPSSGGVSVVGPTQHSVNTYYIPLSDPMRNQWAIDTQWHNAIQQQKAIVANLEHQLDVAQKNEARSAHRYPITGNPRYEAYQDEVANLKQEIEDAKKQLADVQDEAHKAGANKAYD